MNIPAQFWAKTPFDSLNETDRVEFESACEMRSFDAGAVLYEAEKNSKGLYILISGTLSLAGRTMDTSASAREFVVDEVGALISRGSLLESFSHRHQCAAKTDVEVAFLPRNVFLEAFDANRPFTLRLIDFIVLRGSDDVRALNQAIHGLLSQS